MRSDLLAVLVRGGRSPGETTSLAGPVGDAMPTCVGEGAGRGDVSEARGSGGVGREAAEAVEAAASPPPSENAQEPGTTPPGTAPSPRACCGGTSTAGGLADDHPIASLRIRRTKIAMLDIDKPIIDFAEAFANPTCAEL